MNTQVLPVPATGDDQSWPTVAEIIRDCIKEAGAPFHANDNISAFIRPGELEQLQKLVENDIQAMLTNMVIDTENDHNSNETAKRVAKMFMRELYWGRYEPMPSVTVFPNVKKVDQLYVVGPVTVKSTCFNHLH